MSIQIIFRDKVLTAMLTDTFLLVSNLFLTLLTITWTLNCLRAERSILQRKQLVFREFTIGFLSGRSRSELESVFESDDGRE